MIYRGPAFSPSDDLASPPSPVSKLGPRHKGRLRKGDKLLTGEVGEGMSETPAARKLGTL
jgi:hypothetical protein